MRRSDRLGSQCLNGSVHKTFLTVFATFLLDAIPKICHVPENPPPPPTQPLSLPFSPSFYPFMHLFSRVKILFCHPVLSFVECPLSLPAFLNALLSSASQSVSLCKWQ